MKGLTLTTKEQTGLQVLNGVMVRQRPLASGRTPGLVPIPVGWYVLRRSTIMPNDPEGRLVVVQVTCPSTGSEYLLRAPLEVTSRR